ncbi:hypothetical protein LZ31DRAFT_171409 [Colletotrichum somersetense]|nr:hypothetical protein LZ31DRAFT_171409 [Colletotrichum somersetense]
MLAVRDTSDDGGPPFTPNTAKPLGQFAATCKVSQEPSHASYASCYAAVTALSRQCHGKVFDNGWLFITAHDDRLGRYADLHVSIRPAVTGCGPDTKGGREAAEATPGLAGDWLDPCPDRLSWRRMRVAKSSIHCNAASGGGTTITPRRLRVAPTPHV